jgi:hypothetical protein
MMREETSRIKGNSIVNENVGMKRLVVLDWGKGEFIEGAVHTYLK